MFARAGEARFIEGEHEMLRWWGEQGVFARLLAKNAGGPKWSFLDGPITANNPMGVHHAWGRTYKDAYQRYRAMTGHELRYQNGFDCQGLWVEVEVEKEMGLGTKTAIAEHGIDRFVRACKRRVLTFAARQTEQSIRLGYWMDWDDPDELRKLAAAIGQESGDRSQGTGGIRSTLNPQPSTTYITARGQQVTGTAEDITARLGNPEWGGSYFTFSTENNETIWTFLKKCFERGKIYLGHDVMPWGGRAGSAYSQMEIADGRRLTTHRSCFVRLPIIDKSTGARHDKETRGQGDKEPVGDAPKTDSPPLPLSVSPPQEATPDDRQQPQELNEYLLVWTTTPWTLTSNVAAAVNPDLEYVRVKAQIRGDDAPAYYYFAKDNLEFQRLQREYKEGFGRPEWQWPDGLGKLKSIAQIFKEQGGYEVVGTIKGAEMIGWRYTGPFDDLEAQQQRDDSKVLNVFDYSARDLAEFFGGSEPLYRDWIEREYDFAGLWGFEHSYIDRVCKALLPLGTDLERREQASVEMLHDVIDDEEWNAQSLDIKKFLSDVEHDVPRAQSVAVFARNAVLQQALAKFRSILRVVLEEARLLGLFQAPVPERPSFGNLDSFLRQFGLCHNDRRWKAFGALGTILHIESSDGISINPTEDEEHRRLLEPFESWTSVRSDSGEFDALFPHELWEEMQRFIYDFGRELSRFRGRSAIEAHHVIDGGRDFKGNPHVVAGEGTGIVHIAPGCGDVDHQIGQQLGLVSIAPLREDGTFGEGFGPFTGREAIDPETADLVFEELQRKKLLVYVETYPHIYPHCWRTGEELVFRLVDEWFINMDWRDEIKEVTKAIHWLPDSIQGQERELEWLSTMRDWMISKKRFWGLALPIWVNPDDPTDFKVVGSLAELKQLATNGGEGWEQFEGHTPHRPWIDAVKIPSDRHPGQLLSRVEDVGNPWLDAGITPFSTLNYRAWKESVDHGAGGIDPQAGAPAIPIPRLTSGARLPTSGARHQPSTINHQPSPLNWKDWYPADFVTECFPGQFRNWFYSLLALSTMMRYDETDDPEQKRPFKCLLGHRLVMDESGNPMHKSDGTAIWFEEAAEQLGVDTLRWLYLAQNPASDLRFGTRHPDEPVTLETPEGPISQTKEGLPTVKVTSGPADEVRRQVLIPLWNSYAFFVNYAVADQFDPTLPQVPLADRPEIDRWILSRLQELTALAHESFQAYDVARFMKAAEAYIDDLSNWYIRRNRRRFWRSRGDQASPVLQQASPRRQQASPRRQSGDGGGSSSSPETSVARNRSSTNPQTDVWGSPGWDPDKLAAYQTLHEVLLTLSKLLAPCIPFLAERMYQNLATTQASPRRQSGDGGASASTVNTSSTTNRSSTIPEADATGSPTAPRSLDVPESVHLCEYPTVDESKLDRKLNRDAARVQTLVRLGHRLRESAEVRVRQPLAELRFAVADAETATALEENAALIADELNVKEVTRADNLDDLVSYTFKPNLKTLGPKYGKLLGAIRKELPEMDAALLAPLRNGKPVTVTLGGDEVTLEPDDVLISTEQASDWASGDDVGIQVALSTVLTPELTREGMARDFVRHIQQARKDADLDITDRITIEYAAAGAAARALEEWSDYIKAETLADALTKVDSVPDGREVKVGDESVTFRIARV